MCTHIRLLEDSSLMSLENMPEKPVAHDHGLVFGLVCGVVVDEFGLLGFPGTS